MKYLLGTLEKARNWVHDYVKPRNIYLKGYFIQVKIRNGWHFALDFFSREKFPRICAYFSTNMQVTQVNEMSVLNKGYQG